jgi:hypothetical protein
MNTESSQQTPFPQDSLMESISGLLNGVGGLTTSILKGNETGMDYRFKAQEAGFNAQEAGISVKQLWNQEIWKEGQIEEKGAQMIGAERAAQAAQGINVSSPASRQITNETANITGKDIFTLRNNAFMKAFGYEAQQMQDTSESKLDTIKANEAESAGLFGGIAQFVGSGLKALPGLGVTD